MKDYKLTSAFKGYNTKEDKTKLKAGYLVSGSQNVISTDRGTVKSRGGYTLDGAANTAATPVESSYDWDTHSGVERNLKAYDDELEVRISGTWTRLLDSWASVAFQFAEYWDTNEGQDMLFFVNGDDVVYAWSGGLAIISATTANTIKKTGTETWAEARFIADGTDFDKKVYINDTVYTYTGGEGTTTLTGVTPDPTGEADASNVLSSITSTADIPGADFNCNLIGTFRNQVWYGNTKNRQVYISKVNDWNDVTVASPRNVGEGALLTLDGVTVGFVPQEDAMYVTAGKDQWYKSKFTLSADLTDEDLTVERLKTAPRSAAQSQNLITKVKNAVVFVSNQPTLDDLGSVENIPNEQQVPLSDPIKPDFDEATFTNGDMIFYKTKVYIALPSDSKVYIYDLEKKMWDPPQLLAIRRFAIIGGVLYGHSSIQPETYKLFTGTNDNAFPMYARAIFSYQNYGKRLAYKNFDEFMTEGYIATATDLKLKLKYDYDGAGGEEEKDIDGLDADILFTGKDFKKIGIKKIGTRPKGGGTPSPTTSPKFRQINPIPRNNFHEMQVEFTTNQADASWEILAFGTSVQLSDSETISIKK